MIYAACRWWNGNVVMLCMTVSRGSPRSSWHLIKLRLWTTSDKMAPWCNGGRESRRSSVPPKQELRTNLLNLFYQSCLPGAQEREEEQGLGSEGEEGCHGVPGLLGLSTVAPSVLCGPQPLWANLPQGFIAAPAPLAKACDKQVLTWDWTQKSRISNHYWLLLVFLALLLSLAIEMLLHDFEKGMKIGWSQQS